MFYDKFKQLCDIKGVSCNKAALEMGLSNATPTKWKKTGATPDSATLAKVSKYFGIPVECLINEAESANVIINDISQYQAIFSWTMEQEDVSERVKDVIQAELPESSMPALAVLSHRAAEQETATPVSGSSRFKVTFDDFTYALHNETKDLSQEKKDMLLSMARFMRQEQEKEKGDRQ